MVELKKTNKIAPSWYHVGSSKWSSRPAGYYFQPEGEFVDGSVRCCGPYLSEQDASVAEQKWEESHQ